MNNNTKEDINIINLNLISSIIFILCSLVSLGLTFNEKNNLTGEKKLLTNKQALNISFYNRIIILISVLISLYSGYKNFEKEKINTPGKYKSSLLLSTSVLSLIGSVIILYVAYLNRQEQSLTVSDVENPLI